ncbi:MAG: Peptidoglycan-binding domain 1 protein [Actinomycetia bacterium]|nr:Peptidoglycan-binding domain 1 protein [Actinomycetes bacterium]
MKSTKKAARVTGVGLGVAAAGLTIAGALASVAPAATAAARAPVASAATAKIAAAPPGTAGNTHTVVPPYTVPTRTLKYGMSGSDVKALQQRLGGLKYYPGSANGTFGVDTLEAVWAFQEIQGLPVNGEVDAATGNALVKPKAYKAHYPNGGSERVEVNLGTRVMILYRGGQVALISHISSGGGYYYDCGAYGCAQAITPTGNYRTTGYIAGWVQVPLGEMYNPVFFIGTVYAIHGEPTYGPTGGGVPLNPASHGCVRIPYDIAQFFPTLVKTQGTPVYVYS